MHWHIHAQLCSIDHFIKVQTLKYLALFFSLVSVGLCADELKPFTTDGCSMFPEGTNDEAFLWHSCCVEHDFAYWKGGTEEDRALADETLRACVERAGEPNIASMMHTGVRMGGSPIWPTSYRWGYGWPYPRWYGPLTDEEIAQVLEVMKAMGFEDIPREVLDEEPEDKTEESDRN